MSVNGKCQPRAIRRNSASVRRRRFRAPICFTFAAPLRTAPPAARGRALRPSAGSSRDRLLPEHDPPRRADELRGVRLDRGRVVELARDGAALAGEEVVARERRPRRERVAGALWTSAASSRALPRSSRVGIPYSASSASATSSRFAFPARSPMPLTVPCTQVAPAWTAATAAAVARPKSSWPCQWTGTSSQSTACPTRKAAASGRRDPDRVDDDGLLGARLDRGLVGAAEEVELGPRAVDAEERDRDPLAGGERDRLADPAEHVVVRDAERSELAVRDRALDHGRAHAELGERLDVRLDARAKPQTSARRPASAISRIASASSSDTRGKPASIRSTPASSRACAIASLSSGGARRRPSARRRVASCRRGRRVRASAARARAG